MWEWLTENLDGNDATVKDKMSGIICLFVWFLVLGVGIGSVLAVLLLRG